MIYLDSAATSFLKPPAVRQAMLGAMQHMTSPGRGGHRLAMAAAETVYRCRREAAALLAALPRPTLRALDDELHRRPGLVRRHRGPRRRRSA